MPATVQKDPTHPDFPHGEPRGYKYGCKAGAPCPSEHTCAAAHAESLREHRRKSQNGPDKGRLLSRVQRRLSVTLTVVSFEDVVARSGLDPEAIEWVRGARGQMRVEESLARPLDAAWAWYVYGDDVLAEDFPHGRGFQRHCRCADCGATSARARKALTLGIKTSERFTSDPRIGVHLARLVDAAGSRHALECMTGLQHSTVQGLLADPAAQVRVRTARLIASWSPAQVEAARTGGFTRDGARATRLLWSMRALGYPRGYLLDRAGLDSNRRAFYEDRPVTLATMRAIEALAAEIGDTPATPDLGLEPWIIERAKNAARKRGYYPPAYYDEDGTLDYRSIPGHKWSNMDDRCGSRLHAAYLATFSHSQADISRMVGISDKRVGDVTKALGIVYLNTGSETAIDLKASGPVLARVRDMWHAYEDGTVGPVQSCLLLGIDQAEKMSRTHPEVRDFLAARTIAQARYLSARIRALVAAQHIEQIAAVAA